MRYRETVKSAECSLHRAFGKSSQLTVDIIVHALQMRPLQLWELWLKATL